MNTKRKAIKVILYVILIGLSITMLVPFYWQADVDHDSCPALYQLLCGVWIYQMQVCGKGSHISDVCHDHSGSLAGVHGAAVHPGLQDGAE